MEIDQTVDDEKMCNLIAEKCLAQYQSLPKKGKPAVGKEWTVLSGIVEEDVNAKTFKVVALGTGTKCIGPSKMRNDGRILHDSHAEVIARRAFMRYMYNELKKVYKGEESTVLNSVSPVNGTCTIRSSLQYHYYVSQTPCGDASIIPISASKDDTINYRPVSKRKLSLDKQENLTKHARVENSSDNNLNNVNCMTERSYSDVLRTGGKPVSGEPEDPLEPGCDYHILGSLRNKPGRGETTISMSCSDKIAKWNVLGCLGALISHYIAKPLYFISIIIGKSPYSLKCMKRAVYDRISSITVASPYEVHLPKLLFSNKEFPGKAKSGLLPCGSSIAWCNIHNDPHEASANGFRLGVTRKNFATDKSQCLISKYSLFQSFLEVKSMSELKSLIFPIAEESTYLEYKVAAEKYQKTWKDLRQQSFHNWIIHDKALDKFGPSTDCIIDLIK
uniref:tRNA-specific adenosine deaminase 1-like isoform X1 n=2 Tax=Styela clava TaxID=7725 RepID=UPI00193A2D97|nr:tRNA-specific adenosine deaminase 1-like isoform X1 [Styela clava]